jgi:hypothetical protein
VKLLRPKVYGSSPRSGLIRNIGIANPALFPHHRQIEQLPRTFFISGDHHMCDHSSPFPVASNNLRASLIVLLLLVMQIILPVTAPEARAAEYSVKPLVLSRTPSNEELRAAGQLGGPLYPTRDMTDKAKEADINASFGEAI